MNVLMSSAAGTPCRASVRVWACQHCHRRQWTRFSVVYVDILTSISLHLLRLILHRQVKEQFQAVS